MNDDDPSGITMTNGNKDQSVENASASASLLSSSKISHANNVEETSEIQRKSSVVQIPMSEATGQRIVEDDGAKRDVTIVQRKLKSACRSKSQDPLKCQPHFREMIDKRETRNEELEQIEGDLRERLNMLQCSMPAVMVWNILRMTRESPPSVVRRLIEKQFEGVQGADNAAIPISPSRHYDCRVREIEAERKEAVRRAEEARALLTEKEAAIEAKRKLLEEARKCNQEKREQMERMNREAAELREATRNARGDDRSCETGECGEIRCKEHFLDEVGSLSSISSTDLRCFAKLQELAETEVCMRRQINELERREDAYMRTLQQADELWSNKKGNALVAGDSDELQEQLRLKNVANQQLADRVCQLEDESEKLKKRLIGCTEELDKFAKRVHVDAESGFDDAEADVADREIVAATKTAEAIATAHPDTLNVETTAHPATMDEESSIAPDTVEEGVNVHTKMFDKESEAIVDMTERAVDAPIDLGINVGIGDSKIDEPEEARSIASSRSKPRIEDHEDEADISENWDQVEDSTPTDEIQPTKSKIDHRVEVQPEDVSSMSKRPIIPKETVDNIQPMKSISTLEPIHKSKIDHHFEIQPEDAASMSEDPIILKETVNIQPMKSITTLEPAHKSKIDQRVEIQPQDAASMKEDSVILNEIGDDIHSMKSAGALEPAHKSKINHHIEKPEDSALISEDPVILNETVDDIQPMKSVGALEPAHKSKIDQHVEIQPEDAASMGEDPLILEKTIETIPEDWDWDEGCPPGAICSDQIEDSTPIDDLKPMKSFGALKPAEKSNDDEIQPKDASSMSEDPIMLRKTVETVPESDQIVLSREELRNWYNIVDSVQHTISKCENCSPQTKAMAQLTDKMRNKLWSKAFAGLEGMIDEDSKASLTLGIQIPREILRDAGVEAEEPRASEPLIPPAKIPLDVPSDASMDLDKFVEGIDPDLKELSDESKDTTDISTERLLGDGPDAVDFEDVPGVHEKVLSEQDIPRELELDPEELADQLVESLIEPEDDEKPEEITDSLTITQPFSEAHIEAEEPVESLVDKIEQDILPSSLDISPELVTISESPIPVDVDKLDSTKENVQEIIKSIVEEVLASPPERSLKEPERVSRLTTKETVQKERSGTIVPEVERSELVVPSVVEAEEKVQLELMPAVSKVQSSDKVVVEDEAEKLSEKTAAEEKPMSEQATVDVPYLSGGKVESEQKVRLPTTMDICLCESPISALLSERARKLGREGGTQTSPQIPRTLDRVKLKTVMDSAWRPTDVVMWRQPLIRSRRLKDKSTLTTVSVDTQTDSALARDRITQRGFDRKDDCTCSGVDPKKNEFDGGYHKGVSSRQTDERLPAPVGLAELFVLPRLQPSVISKTEKEITVTTFAGRSLPPEDSEIHCVECGKSITPGGTPSSVKPSLTATTQRSLVETMKKIASASISRIGRRKNDFTCCECKTIDKTKTSDDSDKREVDESFDQRTCNEKVCCPCPSAVKEKIATESSKPRKKKRKTEKKDQSVTANIPRHKLKKHSEEKRKNVDPTTSSVVAEKKRTESCDECCDSSKMVTEIVTPSLLTKHSQSSRIDRHHEKSKTKTSTNKLAVKVSSANETSKCGCGENGGIHVPYMKYSSIFKTNFGDCSSIESVSKEDCNCADEEK